MASKGQQGTGSPAAFITPYLDAAKVAEDVLHTLGDAFVRKTTEEWEEFIQDAQEEWEELLLQRPLGGITEHSSMEEEDEDSVETVEGKIHLTLPPELFAWKDKRAFPILGLKRTDSKASEEVEELQAAVKDLYTYLVDVSDMAREDSSEVFNHMSTAIQKVVDAIDHVNTRRNHWQDLIGDVRALRDDSGNSMFTLVGVIQDLMTPPHTQVIDKEDKVDRVKSLMVKIDEDMIYNFTFLNDRVKALERQATTAQEVEASLGTFDWDTPVVDAHSLQVSTIRKILEDNDRLVLENVTLLDKLDQLAADITAQGRAVLGRHTFSLEGNVRYLAMLECPSGDAFVAFVDPMVLFNHDAMYVPVTNWEKMTRAMEESGTLSVTNRKVVASYNLQYLFWHTEGKQVVMGKVLAVFASAEKWSGMGGMDGQRVEIELSADTAADAVCTMIADRLSAGSQLAQLVQMMLEHTQRWLLTVHKHLDAELTKLMQMNILEEEALILLSEDVIIMFDCFYAIRHKRMDFVVKGSRVEYMVWCIWILLQVHMAMDDFVKDGLKYNLAISAAFNF
jgi:hypothetical protein